MTQTNQFASVHDAYPMTNLQAGMLYHSEVQQDSVYHDVASYLVRTRLNLDKFKHALKYITDRHPVLRTSFDLTNFSEPLQLVHDSVDIPLVYEDISSYSINEQEKIMNDKFERELMCTFDWEKAPLFRVFVFHREKDLFQFFFSFHHSILDGWSLALVVSELVDFYSYLLGERSASLPWLAEASFKDFVALEREALNSAEVKQFWRNYLEDCSFTRINRTTLNDESRGLESIGCVIPTEIYRSLNKVASSLCVPLKSVLLATHVRVMSLLSNKTDIVTGLVTNGRPEVQDGERIAGLFLNNVPFRLRLASGTWEQLILQAFYSEQSMYAHRRYPIAALQKDNGGSPLFETVFIYIHFHNMDNDEFPKIENSRYYEKTGFPLTTQFSLDPKGKELSLVLSYETSEISDQCAREIMSYYQMVLRAIADNASDQHHSYCFLTEEQKETLNQWNDTGWEISNQCIHQLFEHQVAQSPDDIALIFEDQELTYRELNHRSNLLADYLQRLAVGRETLVGLCLERSVDIVISILAVLKAGGAYLPIDPAYPSQRIEYLLSDSKVPVLLTHEKLLDRFPSKPQLQIIPLDVIDGIWLEQASETDHNSCVNVSPDDLAYVIYTSGSTGNPKGVMVSHRNVCNLFQGISQSLSIGPNDTFLSVTSFSFDISVLELLWTLTRGIKVVLLSDHGLTWESYGKHEQTPYSIPDLLDRHKVTLMQCTPSLLTYILDFPNAEQALSTLKKLLVGGEPMPTTLARRIMQTLPTKLYNMYGPTETTIWSTICELDLENPVTLGKPLANTQVCIVDKFLQPIPPGHVGEICISGGGVTRGYLNQSGLTDERFVNNSIFPTSKRMYRTGDLGRFLDNGSIEFLGRIDNQIKIRGYRVEVGELEAVLGRHPNIHEVVVIPQTGLGGTSRLIAYIVANGDLNKSSVKNYLVEHVPNYMIPSAFVFLKRMPIKPNGKIDIAALPQVDYSNEKSRYQPARNPVEQELVDVWEKILDTQPIGVHDDFFELGGHSILALKMMNEMKGRLGKTLPLSTLLNGATIEYLASILDEPSSSVEVSDKLVVTIQKHGNERPIFAVHPLGGQVLCFMDLAKNMGNDRPFYGIQSKGHNGDRPLDSIQNMAKLYIEEIKNIQPTGPYTLAGYCMGGVVIYEMAQQFKQQGDVVEHLVIIDTNINEPIINELTDDAKLMVFMLGEDLNLSVDGIRTLSPDDQLRYLVEYAAASKNVDVNSGDYLQTAKNLMAVYKAHRKALLDYSFDPYDGKAIVFMNEYIAQSVRQSWLRVLSPDSIVAEVPGDHSTLIQNPHAEGLAQKIRSYLHLGTP